MMGTSVVEYIPCAATSGSNEVTDPKRVRFVCFPWIYSLVPLLYGDLGWEISLTKAYKSYKRWFYKQTAKKTG